MCNVKYAKEEDMRRYKKILRYAQDDNDAATAVMSS